MEKELKHIEDHLYALLTKKHWTHPGIKITVEKVEPLAGFNIDELFITIKIEIGEHKVQTEIIPAIASMYTNEFVILLEVVKSILLNYAIQALTEGYKVKEIPLRTPSYDFYFLSEEREKAESITKESYEEMIKNYETLNIVKDICKTTKK